MESEPRQPSAACGSRAAAEGIDRSAARREGAPRPARRRVSTKLWAVGGFAFFGLGALGAVVPILPTTPFLLVAAFCFARSSERLNAWFRATKLYRTVLEGYVQKRSMTVKAKLLLLVPLTVVLGISFACMGRVPVGRAVVAVVWIAHVIYFGFVVRTDAAPSAATAPAAASQACK